MPPIVWLILVLGGCGDAASPYRTGDLYRLVATDYQWYDCASVHPSSIPRDSVLCGNITGAFAIWLRTMAADVTIGEQPREIPSGHAYLVTAHIESTFCYYAQGCAETVVDTFGALFRDPESAPGRIEVSLPHGTVAPNRWLDDLVGVEHASGEAEGLHVTGTGRAHRRVEWFMYRR